jgi:hypothetical protein
MEALEGNGVGATGKADAFCDLGNSADGSKFLLVARHEQYTLLLAGVHGERVRHAREDDDVVHRD